MGALIFRCPRSGKTIKTGIETDEYTLVAVRSLSMQVRCEHCGREHAFEIREGELADAA
jgi:transcription elongation factor Elf1